MSETSWAIITYGSHKDGIIFIDYNSSSSPQNAIIEQSANQENILELTFEYDSGDKHSILLLADKKDINLLKKYKTLPIVEINNHQKEELNHYIGKINI